MDFLLVGEAKAGLYLLLEMAQIVACCAPGEESGVGILEEENPRKIKVNDYIIGLFFGVSLTLCLICLLDSS